MKTVRSYIIKARLWMQQPANGCVLMITIGALLAQAIVLAIVICLTPN